MAEQLDNQIFSRTDVSEDKIYDFELNVDPKSHVFSQINDICECFTDDQVKSRIRS